MTNRRAVKKWGKNDTIKHMKKCVGKAKSRELTPDTPKLVCLYHKDGYDFLEIAYMLDRPIKQVRQILDTETKSGRYEKYKSHCEQTQYENLANAVIKQTISDYVDARKKLRKHPDNFYAKCVAEDCECFLRSSWASILTNLNIEWLMKNIERQLNDV